MILAIDFDGVIHDPYNVPKGYKLGQPIAGAPEALQKLQAEGHTIIIFTIWAVEAARIKAIEDWCKYFKVPFDKITATKIRADYYIDDRGLHFDNWPETLNKLEAPNGN